MLPRPHSAPWSLERSKALLSDAERLIPGVTLSMMKRPEHFCLGRFPVYLQSGSGALVEDVDGNQYVDFICGLGANSLGHGHPAVRRALGRVAERGLLHSLPTDLELEATQALVDLVPGAEMARFFKTGADATSAAVRLARFVTGRERLITVGYNGWHDHFMVDTPGVPQAVAQLTTRAPLFADADEGRLLDVVRAQGSEVAAVLLSLPFNREISREFLVTLREECTRVGALLVFDEVITGLRLGLGGAAERYGVQPDFATFSKAIAAGMPLSAVVGPRKHLAEMAKLQVSTTFGGELASLAVCVETLREYRENDYVSHVAALGRRLKLGIERVASEVGSPLRVVGYDAVPLFLFDPQPVRHAQLMQPFQGEMAARGVLLRRDVNFPCAAHTEAQIDFTIDAARESLLALRGAA